VTATDQGSGTRDTLAQLVTELHLLGGTASRAELTERLGRGRSVMGYLLSELTDRGIVTIDRATTTQPTGRQPTGRQPTGRQPTGRPSTGRPSHQVTVAPSAPAVIAVHLDVDTVTVATVGLGGRVLTRHDEPVPATLDALLDILTTRITTHLTAHGRILAVGLAVPSPVRRTDGRAVAALHLGWPAIPLRDLLTTRLHPAAGAAGKESAEGLGGPADMRGSADALPVLVGNDANLAGLAEHRHGAGRGARQLLYLTTAHVGLGGALVSGGRLFDGAHGYAIEPGHITVDPAGAPCSCGSTGCLEVEADHRGLLRAAGRTGLPVHEIAGAATALLEAAGGGDGPALAAVRHVAARLGSGLASLTNLTDPDRVVLAGSLARYHALAAGDLTTSLAARSFLSHADSDADPVGMITTAELADAALLGAADLALQGLLDDPRGTIDRLPAPAPAR
jgi:predicted NBD/HSP70 family sugar kinase